jgi:hypothetical protein
MKWHSVYLIVTKMEEAQWPICHEGVKMILRGEDGKQRRKK